MLEMPDRSNLSKNIICVSEKYRPFFLMFINENYIRDLSSILNLSILNQNGWVNRILIYGSKILIFYFSNWNL